LSLFTSQAIPRRRASWQNGGQASRNRRPQGRSQGRGGRGLRCRRNQLRDRCRAGSWVRRHGTRRRRRAGGRQLIPALNRVGPSPCPARLWASVSWIDSACQLYPYTSGCRW